MWQVVDGLLTQYTSTVSFYCRIGLCYYSRLLYTSVNKRIFIKQGLVFTAWLWHLFLFRVGNNGCLWSFVCLSLWKKEKKTNDYSSAQTLNSSQDWFQAYEASNLSGCLLCVGSVRLPLMTDSSETCKAWLKLFMLSTMLSTISTEGCNYSTSHSRSPEQSICEVSMLCIQKAGKKKRCHHVDFSLLPVKLLFSVSDFNYSRKFHLTDSKLEIQ